MASVAIVTAVSKPKVKSVALRSLSMVLGTPTTGRPSWYMRVAAESVPSPPMAMMAPMPLRSTERFTRSRPCSTLKGLMREVPRMVPPRCRMPLVVSRVSRKW